MKKNTLDILLKEHAKLRSIEHFCELSDVQSQRLASVKKQLQELMQSSLDKYAKEVDMCVQTIAKKIRNSNKR